MWKQYESIDGASVRMLSGVADIAQPTQCVRAKTSTTEKNSRTVSCSPAIRICGVEMWKPLEC